MDDWHKTSFETVSLRYQLRFSARVKTRNLTPEEIDAHGAQRS